MKDKMTVQHLSQIRSRRLLEMEGIAEGRWGWGGYALNPSMLGRAYGCEGDLAKEHRLEWQDILDGGRGEWGAEKPVLPGESTREEDELSERRW